MTLPEDGKTVGTETSPPRAATSGRQQAETPTDARSLDLEYLRVAGWHLGKPTQRQHWLDAELPAEAVDEARAIDRVVFRAVAIVTAIGVSLAPIGVLRLIGEAQEDSGVIALILVLVLVLLFAATLRRTAFVARRRLFIVLGFIMVAVAMATFAAFWSRALAAYGLATSFVVFAAGLILLRPASVAGRVLACAAPTLVVIILLAPMDDGSMTVGRSLQNTAGDVAIVPLVAVCVVSLATAYAPLRWRARLAIAVPACMLVMSFISGLAQPWVKTDPWRLVLAVGTAAQIYLIGMLGPALILTQESWRRRWRRAVVPDRVIAGVGTIEERILAISQAEARGDLDSDAARRLLEPLLADEPAQDPLSAAVIVEAPPILDDPHNPPPAEEDLAL